VDIEDGPGLPLNAQGLNGKQGRYEGAECSHFALQFGNGRHG
jgi:hypothetical protein